MYITVKTTALFQRCFTSNLYGFIWLCLSSSPDYKPPTVSTSGSLKSCCCSKKMWHNSINLNVHCKCSDRLFSLILLHNRIVFTLNVFNELTKIVGVQNEGVVLIQLQEERVHQIAGRPSGSHRALRWKLYFSCKDVIYLHLWLSSIFRFAFSGRKLNVNQLQPLNLDRVRIATLHLIHPGPCVCLCLILKIRGSILATTLSPFKVTLIPSLTVDGVLIIYCTVK